MPPLLQAWAEAGPATVLLSYVTNIGVTIGSLYLIGIAFYFIERWRPAAPQTKFFKRDFWNEAGYPLFNTVVSTPTLTFLNLGLSAWVLSAYVPYQPFAAQMMALPFFVQVLLALLIADIAVYVEHQIAHRYLWNYHALHHMTPEVTWLTHARVHPVNAITIGLAAGLASYVFGFSGEAVVIAAWIASGLAIWEHANLDFAWPRPFCYLLVSPRYHRWHHSSDQEAIDKNFCLIFPFLDLLFGTYYCPDRMPTEYGVHSEVEARHAGRAGEIPETFLGQIAYPFRKTLGRSRLAATDAPPALAND